MGAEAILGIFYNNNNNNDNNPASVQENDTQKLLLDFDILTDHLISARRHDLIMKIKVVSDLSRQGLESSLFNSYDTKV